MRAAVAERVHSPLVLSNLPEPALGPHDVLVQIKAAGVCYTDLKAIDGGGAQAMPLIPGHEPVGVVAHLGSSVTGVAVGDRVGVHGFFGCGECAYCSIGEDEACVHGGSRLAGMAFNGAYAEYMRAPARQLIPLPADLDFVDAAPLFCAGLTSYAGLKNGNIRPGQRVVIIGIGGLGHLAVPIAKALGGEVFAVTTTPEKADFAKELGATFAADVDTVATELANRGGAHLVLSTANSLEPVGRLVDGMAKQATIVLAATEGDVLPIAPRRFIDLQLTVKGTFYGSRQDMRDLLALTSAHRIRGIIEQYPLDQVNAVHDRLRANLVRYRAVLVP